MHDDIHALWAIQLLLYTYINTYRLQDEVKEVLNGATTVTKENLQKLQYTEQVYIALHICGMNSHNTKHIHFVCSSIDI